MSATRHHHGLSIHHAHGMAAAGPDPEVAF
jgi:hypothetical protein